MERKPFQKKYTAEPTANGYTIAFYGVLTGQSYATPEAAQVQIDSLNQRDLKKQRKNAAEKRKSKTQN